MFQRLITSLYIASDEYIRSEQWTASYYDRLGLLVQDKDIGLDLKTASWSAYLRENRDRVVVENPPLRGCMQAQAPFLGLEV